VQHCMQHVLLQRVSTSATCCDVAEVESSPTSATLRATNYVVLARASQLRAISFMGEHTLQQNCQQYCTQCCTVCPHLYSKQILYIFFTFLFCLPHKGAWDAGARNARMYIADDHPNKRVGGWCAASSKNQWLQVDLGTTTYVTAVATQGECHVIFERLQTLHCTEKDGDILPQSFACIKHQIETTEQRVLA